MFDSTVITKRINAQMDVLRTQRPTLEPADYTPEQARAWMARLAEKKGAALDAEEQDFLLATFVRAKADYRWWAERYSFVKTKELTRTPMRLFESQDLILRQVAEVERRVTMEGKSQPMWFQMLKARQLGACLDPNTRILTANLEWVTLQDVAVGTEIVACDEYPEVGQGKARKMRTTTVEAKHETCQPSYRLTFNDGSTIIASEEHKFLHVSHAATTGRRMKMDWRPTKEFVVGDSIRMVCTTWEPTNDYDDGWISGMFDGEGCLQYSYRSGATACIAQVFGPVYERIKQVFANKGYHFTEEVDRRKGGERSKFGNKPVAKLTVGRMDELFKILGQTRPTRFITQRWWEGKALPGKSKGNLSWRKIAKIEFLGDRRVIDIQTGTKTFIAEGLVSHNSTLVQSIIAHRVTFYGNVNGLIAADVQGQSAYLFDMFERTIENLPWWMAPTITEHTKSEEIKFDTDSNVWLGWGKSKRGAKTATGHGSGELARGRTVHVGHLSEISTWEDASQIDDAVEPALSKSANAFLAMESSPKGRNWWYQKWQQSVSGAGDWTPVFVGWYTEPSLRVPPPTDWAPLAETVRHASHVERVSQQWNGRTIRLTPDQMYWWERKYQAAKAERKLYKFLAEYAADPETCFTLNDTSVFGTELLLEQLERAKPLVNVVQVYR